MARVVKRVKDLLLDQDNPRIGHVASQPEALEAIIELDERHFKEMMTSVRDHGIDPGDSFYVVDEGDGKPFLKVSTGTDV